MKKEDDRSVAALLRGPVASRYAALKVRGVAPGDRTTDGRDGGTGSARRRDNGVIILFFPGSLSP